MLNSKALTCKMTPEMQERGPVCECRDPHCFEPLGISWEEWERRGTACQIASTCQTKEPRS